MIDLKKLLETKLETKSNLVNFTNIPLKDVYNAVENGSNKGYTIDTDLFYYGEEKSLLDILENFRLRYLEEQVKLTGETNTNNYVNVRAVDGEFKEDFYVLYSRGIPLEGSRVTRKKEVAIAGKMSVRSFEIITSPIFIYAIYTYMNKDYNQDLFEEQYNQLELNRLYKLIISFMSRCISELEFRELMRLLERDQNCIRFGWQIEDIFSTYSKDLSVAYKYPNPFEAKIFKDRYLFLTTFENLYRDFIISIYLPVFQRLIYKIDADKTFIRDKSCEEEKYFQYDSIIRCADSYRLVVERDYFNEVDFNIDLMDTQIRPIVREIEPLRQTEQERLELEKKNGEFIKIHTKS